MTLACLLRRTPPLGGDSIGDLTHAWVIDIKHNFHVGFLMTKTFFRDTCCGGKHSVLKADTARPPPPSLIS